MVRMVDGRKMVAMLCAIAGLSIVIQLSFDHASINLQKPTLSDLTKLWTSATSGTLAAGLFYALFTSWLWKLPLLHDWLVEYPDLGGTWEGVSHSDTFGGDHPVTVSIVHRFDRLTYTAESPASTNRALTGMIGKNENANVVLTVAYHNEPAPDREKAANTKAHDGCLRLTLEHDPGNSKHQKLTGVYWTNKSRTSGIDRDSDKGTTGTLYLKRRK